jgi:hypothetical protein
MRFLRKAGASRAPCRCYRGEHQGWEQNTVPITSAPPLEELAAWTGHYRLMTYRPELAAPFVHLLDRFELTVEEGRLI